MRYIPIGCLSVLGWTLLFCHPAYAQAAIDSSVDSKPISSSKKTSHYKARQMRPAASLNDHISIDRDFTQRHIASTANGSFAATATVGLRLTGYSDGWQKLDNRVSPRRAQVNHDVLP